ncbi:MAG: hypothetical protein JWO57_1227 [Pseudonocardiales bacterium]|nr:hypothetical protein [Pseudonocardiales bacterium]
MTALSTPDSFTHWIVTLLDVEDSQDLRKTHGPAHRAYAATIEDRIVLAGPTYAEDDVTMNGSVFVVNFETREEVEAFVAADPFVLNRVYESWTIVLFKNAWPYQG